MESETEVFKRMQSVFQAWIDVCLYGVLIIANLFILVNLLFLHEILDV